MIGRRGLAPGVPTGHRIPAQGNALGTVNASPGVLKERRILVIRGRLPSPTRCGVPSERLDWSPWIPRVAPWAGMRRPVGAVKPLPIPRSESIEVRRRQGSSGWFANRPDRQGEAPWVRGPPARSSGVPWMARSLVAAEPLVLSVACPGGIFSGREGMRAGGPRTQAWRSRVKRLG